MTIDISVLLEICAGISCVCVAIGWLVKVVKIAKKPIDNLEDKFETYDKKFKETDRAIKSLENIAKNNTECLQLLLESTLTMLSHMEDNNHYGEIKAQKTKIQSYLMEKAM